MGLLFTPRVVGHPAKSQPTIFMCSASFLRALVCLSAPSLLGRFGADTVIQPASTKTS